MGHGGFTKRQLERYGMFIEFSVKLDVCWKISVFKCFPQTYHFSKRFPHQKWMCQWKNHGEIWEIPIKNGGRQKMEGRNLQKDADRKTFQTVMNIVCVFFFFNHGYIKSVYLFGIFSHDS